LDDSASHYGIVALRILFLTILALTIAGVRMHAQPDNPTVVHVGQKLAEAGSLLSIVLLGLCLVGEVYAWLNYRCTLSLKSQKVYILKDSRREFRLTCSVDADRELDGQTATVPQTGLLLLGDLSSRHCGQDLESFDRLHDRVGLHGTRSRICYSFSVLVGRLHDSSQGHG
jgi:hypothetical protein